MHLNYYFLRQLSIELKERLLGGVFIEAFSQEKDELIICFKLNSGHAFFIRATLTSNFTCLSFPDDFKRSRKNSVNLFEELENLRISDVYQFKNERAFQINFENNLGLLFKLHGNRSNVILNQDGSITKLFNSRLTKDNLIEIHKLDRSAEYNFEAFQKDPNLKKHFPTFGKVVKEWLNQLGYDNLDIYAKWDLLLKTKSLLEKPQYFLHQIKAKPTFSLLEFKNTKKLSSNPIEAINQFYDEFSRVYFFQLKKDQTLKTLIKRQKQIENYISRSRSKLESLRQSVQPKEIGDILMANLHAIKPGELEVELFNFYSNENLKIRLNRNLSPQKNAENYYRKGKNRRIEEEKIMESIESKTQSLSNLKSLVTQVELSGSHKILNQLIKEDGSTTKSTEKLKSLPYREFLRNGFKIWVGKSAKLNDELSLKYRHKEDLWLHAKDVAGSHVLVKYDSSRSFDKQIIEKAAEIAAYYSKRKTDSLAPVAYTLAKFVRKKKGSPPGTVLIEKEKVILVAPKDPSQIA